MKKTLNDLQSEKLRLVDMLEIEKEKLNELHRTYQTEHIEYQTNEVKRIQRQIADVRQEIE